MNKTCIQCGQIKPLDGFTKSAEYRGGRSNLCKKCHGVRAKAWKKSNPLAVAQQKARRKAKHREKIREYHRSYYAAHKEKYFNYARQFKAANPEKRKAHQALNNAIRDGKLVKPTACSSCGVLAKRIEGHHPDYARPLDVVWLCAGCHRIADRAKRTQAAIG